MKISGDLLDKDEIKNKGPHFCAELAWIKVEGFQNIFGRVLPAGGYF